MNYIFVTGGVISGLGKGIVAASIGKILKNAGWKINVIKLDPYLQVDAGTMSPYEHGEVFVTEDGYETDLDLGHYERFLNQNLTGDSSITSGRIFQAILNQERDGKYLGQTIQVIPHVTDEIKERLQKHQDEFDVTIVEVGGTIGDIEAPHFLEAIRQMRQDIGRERTMYIHVAPLMYLRYSGEVKTKPIQHSVRELTRLGIQPDMIVARTEVPMSNEIREKISLFCNIEPPYVIEGIDAESIYQVPQLLLDQHVDQLVQERLALQTKETDLTEWNQRTRDFLHPERSVTIGMVGKYAEFQDAYLSVSEALKHAGAYHKTRVNMHWIQAEEFDDPAHLQVLEEKIDGLLIPGGFGERGMEGKIKAAQLAREHRLPYLGLCLGLQMAVVEFARHVAKLDGAHTIESDQRCDAPVISRMPGQSDELAKGGSMRLGNYTTQLQPGSRSYELYQSLAPTYRLGEGRIIERHRHRFEVNPTYYDQLEEAGLLLAGRDEATGLVEFVELVDHPFFIATQAHPEFQSRLDAPHPLFVGFVEACLEG